MVIADLISEKTYRSVDIVPTGHVGQTTCSAETARLGGNQTVVAFTFYGDDTYDTFNRDYFSGIEVRLF